MRFAHRLRGPAVAFLAVVLAFAFVQWWDFRAPSVGRARYQAVFLVSGQTYFGHYFDRLGPYARIDGVYYIQPVAGEDPEQPPQSRIVRRGAELHAPLPTVLVAKTAVLFVEDLQPGSPVAEFIDADQAAGR